MTEFVWADLRDQAIRAFGGELPGASTEQALIHAFEQNPARVAAELPRVGTDFAEGRIRSGWAIWRTRVEQAPAARNPTVTDATERDRVVQKAEQWIRTVGVHYDRWDELDGELFRSPAGFISGMTGKLTLEPWASDETLHDRLRDLWERERPRGERTDVDPDERAEVWIESRERVLAQARARRDRAEHDAERELVAARALELARKGAA